MDALGRWDDARVRYAKQLVGVHLARAVGQPAQHVGVVLGESLVCAVAELPIRHVVSERGEDCLQGPRARDLADVPIPPALQDVDRHVEQLP